MTAAHKLHQHTWTKDDACETRGRSVYRCPCGASGYRLWPSVPYGCRPTRSMKVPPIVEYAGGAGGGPFEAPPPATSTHHPESPFWPERRRDRDPEEAEDARRRSNLAWSPPDRWIDP